MDSFSCHCKLELRKMKVVLCISAKLASKGYLRYKTISCQKVALDV